MSITVTSTGDRAREAPRHGLHLVTALYLALLRIYQLTGLCFPRSGSCSGDRMVQAPHRDLYQVTGL